MMKSLSLKLLIFLLFLNCAKDTEIDQSPSVIDTPNTELSNDTSDTENSLGYIPCENGMAGIYPCLGFDLLSRVTLNEFGSEYGNDNWGWTDPDTGVEYVLNGLDDGVGFVSIEDPENPVYLGKLPTATDPSPWRDVKVYNNYAFIVSEAQDHGLQVFDLTRLRGLTEAQNFSADAVLNDFGNAHNIAINEDTGFAYVVGYSKKSFFWISWLRFWSNSTDFNKSKP